MLFNTPTENTGISTIQHKSKPGWTCPNCGGWGHMNNGSFSIGNEVSEVVPSTVCWVCKGKGRVLVISIPD